MPYAREQDHRDLYAGEEETDERVGLLHRQAARLVQRYAKAPAAPDPDYAGAARDTELVVGEYLHATGGFRTSSSAGLEGLSTGEGYDLSAVRRMVSEAMGDHATSGRIVVRNARRA